MAVLAVVVFHAIEGMAPGGFVGVDVFFVISGFLITGIIRRSVARGTFGSPTFFVGDEIFFGKDSLRDVEDEIVSAGSRR